MNCRKHPARTAINTCGECGDWLCEECTAEVSGRVYCIPCLQKKWSREHGHDPENFLPPPPPYPHTHARGHVPGEPYPKHVSWGLLFVFSFLPGLNYMYEGLIKRGLFAMISFFLTTYLAGMFGEPMFGFAIAVLWFASFFDGFRIRRILNAGVAVPDNVDDITDFFKAHKAAIILFILAFLALGIIGWFSNWVVGLYVYPLSRFFRIIIATGTLIFGLYLIINSGKKSRPRADFHEPPRAPEQYENNHE